MDLKLLNTTMFILSYKNDFAEWYQDYMTQNPHLFDPTCIHLDSDYIDDWWDEHGENLIEDKWGELGNSGPYEY